jgi:hypothetical protein
MASSVNSSSSSARFTYGVRTWVRARPTTILARTDLVRAAPMGGLVQGEDAD